MSNISSSTDVNLTVKSILGFKRPSGSDPLTGYLFESPRPVLQTTLTLDGETFEYLGINTATRILNIETLPTFDMTIGKVSSPKTVILKNYGNSPITITAITTSSNGVTTVLDQSILPITVPAAPDLTTFSSATFQLRYLGDIEGEWSNNLLFTSDIDVTYFRFRTRQNVGRTYQLDVVPASSTTTITSYGRRITQTYEVTPLINEDPSTELVPLAATVISSTPGWEVTNVAQNELTGKQEVTVRFSSIDVGSSTGTYTASVVMRSEYQGLETYFTATSTAIVDVDVSQFQNIGSWVSPAARYNSVVGISYDRMGSEKFLTIGVGVGGDGTPIYSDGGQSFTATNTLGVLGAETDYPYLGWADVYRFPVPENGQPVQYYSKDYKVKGTYDYDDYFGVETSVGSIFIIDQDGKGNVEVTVNRLREVPEEHAELTATLKNLSRALYYYSDVDGVRFYQRASGPVLDGTITDMFRGFNASGAIKTSLVPLPRSN